MENMNGRDGQARKRPSDGIVHVRPHATLADIDLHEKHRRRSLSTASIKSISKATDRFGHEAHEAAEVSTAVGEDNRTYSQSQSAIKAMERTGTATAGKSAGGRCSLQ